ncbi:MAG: Glu-tRNA(Gln) amidotransferase subunit GatE [Candidatus Micrarchaeia archaeon]
MEEEHKKDENYYKSIGFMCGLEIHQRLATKEKLFCSCSTTIEQDEILIGKIKRHQRAVAGELGEIDLAAEFEELKSREFVYDIYKGHACLVDLDEEPPHPLNMEALEIALQVAKSLHLNIFDEIEPMRKIVVDGSNTSAFQRSIMIGNDGYIEVNGKKIGISSAFLEEESAGIESNSSTIAEYNLDRIGIPLIEIDTEPEISTPEEAKQVALEIGMLLRLTGKVQRGIGSIRQDVNVSIKGGARTEIKGFQELEDMDKYIENEIERQKRLLEIREELKKRDAAVGEKKDLSSIFKHTKSHMIKDAIEAGGEVVGFPLFGFKGILGKELNKNRRLGTELSDYAKFAGVNGLIHSDEDLAKYNISEEEIKSIREFMKLGDNDGFIFVFGSKKKAEKAVDIIIERAKQAMVGVPSETRAVANSKDFTTKVLRPIAGGARMYPETDLKPVMLAREQLAKAENDIINIESERRKLLDEIKDKALAQQMLFSPRLNLYRYLVKETGEEPRLIANLLLQKFTELKREGFDVDNINEHVLKGILEMYSQSKITKLGISELVKEVSVKNRDLKKIISDKKLEKFDRTKIKELLKEELKNIGIEKDAKSKLIREMLIKYRYNIDAEELSQEIDKIIGT